MQIFSCLSQICHKKVKLFWLSLIIEAMAVQKKYYLFQQPKGKIILVTLHRRSLIQKVSVITHQRSVYSRQLMIQQMREVRRLPKKYFNEDIK